MLKLTLQVFHFLFVFKLLNRPWFIIKIAIISIINLNYHYNNNEILPIMIEFLIVKINNNEMVILNIVTYDQNYQIEIRHQNHYN